MIIQQVATKFVPVISQNRNEKEPGGREMDIKGMGGLPATESNPREYVTDG